MSQSRKSQLAEMVREFVFNLIDGEPEFSGGDAGAIAARTQRAFEKEYDNMFDDSIKSQYDDGNCPDCDEPIPDDADKWDSCKNCGHIFTGNVPTDD